MGAAGASGWAQPQTGARTTANAADGVGILAQAPGMQQSSEGRINITQQAKGPPMPPQRGRSPPAAPPQHSGMMPNCTFDTCTTSQARGHYLDQRYDLSAASEAMASRPVVAPRGPVQVPQQKRGARLPSRPRQRSSSRRRCGPKTASCQPSSAACRCHCRHWLPPRAHLPCLCFPVALQPVAGAVRAVPG